MVLEAITLGVIGITYATGNDSRKQKMRKIGKEIAEVAKETASDTTSKAKDLFEKIKSKTAEKSGSFFY